MFVSIKYRKDLSTILCTFFATNLATFGKIKVASMTVKQKVVNSSQLTETKKEKFCVKEREKKSI